MSRITLRLTLDVTYEVNNTHTDDLRDNLMDLATLGMREGLFTGESEAEVIMAMPSVEELK